VHDDHHGDFSLDFDLAILDLRFTIWDGYFRFSFCFLLSGVKQKT